jgi:leucyl aminopeptidase
MKDKFNNQFATQKLRTEMSMTSAGPGSATFTAGVGEQPAPRATKKVVKKKIKKEEKDVEPKLAAGKADVYMKNKWGWKEAPSIPNRPSKGGFIYKQLYEELNENYSSFKKETKTRTNEQQLHAAMRLAEKKIHEANRILEYTTQLRTELNETRVNKNTQRLMEKITKGIAEAYGKMKKLK